MLGVEPNFFWGFGGVKNHKLVHKASHLIIFDNFWPLVSPIVEFFQPRLYDVIYIANWASDAENTSCVIRDKGRGQNFDVTSQKD